MSYDLFIAECFSTWLCGGNGHSALCLLLPEPSRSRLPENENIQPVAGEGRSSTKVVLPGNENPAGRRRLSRTPQFMLRR